MNLNYNEIAKDENILDNPLIKNILNSDINDNEIQNIPENYLVNLIDTLLCWKIILSHLMMMK